jgi:hypothetical protein
LENQEQKRLSLQRILWLLNECRLRKMPRKRRFELRNILIT